MYEKDRQYRASNRFVADREYWSERIRDLPHVDTTEVPPAVRTITAEADLSDTADVYLSGSPPTRDASSAAVVLAAAACFFSRRSGRYDVLVNIPVSARTTAELRRSAGMLVNVVPLRIRVDPSEPVEDLVRRMQVELVGALRHQACGLDDIRRATSEPVSRFSVPLVNVMLFDQQPVLGDIVGTPHVLSRGPVGDRLITVHRRSVPVGTVIEFRANPNRYEENEIQAQCICFTEILEQFVAAAPRTPVGSIHPPSAGAAAPRYRRNTVLDHWRHLLAGAPTPPACHRPRRHLPVDGRATRDLLRRGRSSSIPSASDRVERAPNVPTIVSRSCRLPTRSSSPGRVVPTTSSSVSLPRPVPLLLARSCPTHECASTSRSEISSRTSPGGLGTLSHTPTYLPRHCSTRCADTERIARPTLPRHRRRAGRCGQGGGERRPRRRRPAYRSGASAIRRRCRARVDVHGRAPHPIRHGRLHRATVERIARRLERILLTVEEDPEIRVGDIDLLDAAERTALAPVTGPPPVTERLLPEILTDAALRTPAATAVSCGETRIDYRELDERSNRLARMLAERGAGPERFVAIGMARSVDSIVSIWAVAKTGAAFVPVDPAYPPVRIEYMLRDCGAVLGLTTTGERSLLPGTVRGPRSTIRRWSRRRRDTPGLR